MMSDNNADNCLSCAEPLGGKAADVKCMGICGKRAHVRCQEISASLYKAINEHPSIVFMCSDCLSISSAAIGDRLSKLLSFLHILEERNLRTDNICQDIVRKLDGITDRFETFIKSSSTESTPTYEENESNSNPDDDTQIENFVQTQVKKTRRRKGKNRKHSASSQRESNDDRISSRHSIVGTAEPNEAEGIKAGGEPIKWVHVSRVDGTTTDNALRAFLSARLKIQLDRIQCFRLLKRGIIEIPKIISFKVGVPIEVWEDIFSSTLWPQGIAVREFEFRARGPVAAYPPVAAASPGSSASNQAMGFLHSAI